MYKGHEKIKNIYECSRKFIEENDVNIELLVDFGARHGESYRFLKEFCRGDYVFVEPAPKSIAVIEDLIIGLNDPSHIHLIKAVLGSSEGSIGMHIFEHDDDQSSNVFTDRKGCYGKSEIINVPVFSYEIFDKLFPGKNIDFAKVNIEGSEYQMIEDGFFHKRVKSFVMELHNEHVKDKMWKNAVECLQHDFDIITYGDLGYKYCYMSGIKCV